MAKNSYIIRLGVEGGRKVSATIKQVGSDGERSMKRLHNASARVDTGFQRLSRTVFTRLAPAFSAGFAARSILQNIQNFEKIDMRLKRLTKSSEDYAEVQDFLSKNAQRLNIDIETLAKSYSSLLALEDAGILDRQGVNALAEGFADVKAALGAGDDQIDNVLYGLSQALSQGQVQAQELNQVIEPLPGFLNKIADAAGTTAGGYRQMVKDGEISSEIFRNHVISALKEYEGAAEEMEDTVSASFTRLGNSWKELSRIIGGAGVQGTVAGVADFMADVNYSAIDQAGYFKEVNSVLGEYLLKLSLMKEFGPGINLFAPPGSGTPVPAGNSGIGSRAAMGGFQLSLQENMNAVTGMMNEMGAQIRGDGSMSAIRAPKPGKKPQAIYDRAFKEEEKAAEAARKRAEAIQKIIDGLRFQTEQLSRTAQEQEVYNQLQSAGVSIDSARGQEIANLTRQYIEMKQGIEMAEKATEDMLARAEEFGSAWGNALDNLAVEFNSFGDVVSSLAKDLQRMLFQQFVSNPLRDFAGNLFFGASGGAGGGVDGTRAEGGPVRPGKTYLVGEEGPELLRMGSQGGSVIPNHKIGVGGQSGPTVFIDARGADQAGLARVEAAVRELNGSIEQRSVAAVENKFRRSGSFLR